MDVFQKIESLPVDVRNFFCSNDVRLAMERACFLYDVREEDIKKITPSIRDIFLKNIELNQLPIIIERELGVKNIVAFGIAYELNVKIFSNFEGYFVGATTLLEQWKKNKLPPIVSEEKARIRVYETEPWILEEEKEKNNKKIEEKRKEIKLSLSDAMVQYPKVGEQSVGSEQIKLRYFPMPVRPSIKNWITDFHDGMGAGKHSPMDRGNFLFHSENGKRLNSADRQKLGIILRSLDEQTLLNIDGDAQVIIFENAENTQNESRINAETRNLDSRPPATIAFRAGLRGNDSSMDAVKVTPGVGNAQTSLPSGHLSSSEERMTMKKTLERRNQIQQERNTHDVFGDLAPTPKNENIQDKKLNNKVQDFFAKPAIEKMQNIGNAPSSAHDYMGTFSQREKGESKKTSEPDNYFSIPQSKPPIGSEYFNEGKVQNINNAQTSLPSGHLSSSEERKIMKETLKGQDLDSMSDEDLFNMLREKKIKQDVTKLNSSVGNFKFSSPQKLPAEQEKKPVQKMVQQPLRQQAAPPKQNNFSIKPSSQIKKSPYHISPSDYEYGKKTEANNEATPKIQKNIVDLR